jgi:hypothetical protein
MDEAEDLLNLTRPKRQVSEIAIFGYLEDDLTIAGGFLRVAEIASRRWITHGPTYLGAYALVKGRRIPPTAAVQQELFGG